MKIYHIDHIPANRVLLYSIGSVIFCFAAMILSSMYIYRYIVPGIVLITSATSLFFLGKKVVIQNMKIVIDQDKLIINEKQLLELKDLESYDFNKNKYFEYITLQFHKQKVHFNTSIKSEKYHDFILFKKIINQHVNLLNQNKEAQIQQKGFYNSIYAKPFAYLCIILLAIWLLGMIFKSENFSYDNFFLFLLLTSAIIPMLIKIFKGKKKKQ